MSSSTVAVTANQPIHSPVLALGANTRRRNISSTTEKRTTNIEMVSEGGVSGEQMSSEGKIKDLSALQAKKPLITYTASPRPRKKAVAKTGPEKTRFQKVASVFIKNFVLLIFLLGLVQLISKLLSNNGHKDAVFSPNSVSEIEERIGEIDSLVKKTSKMVQIQFEVVDKKIENEVGGVRRDLMKKVEEKAAILEKELKNLGARTDGLDKSLTELESYKFLTKEDLVTFSEELKKSRGGDSGDEALSLDKINAIARDIVVKEIEKHAADGLGRVDYALASAGAVVVRHSEPLSPVGNWIKIPKVSTAAQKMLQPSFGEPGQCFPLKGSNGFVEVRLRTQIVPDAITLEHVAKSVAYDRSSAPKDCQITGWLQAHDSDLSSQAEKRIMLVKFTYDLEKSNAQTFNVDSANAGTINVVRLDFTSNHGGSHTCIYRLRVHGHTPDVNAVSTLQH